MAVIAAIEAGGTKFICGLGKENGEVIERISIPTTTPDETMRKVIEYFSDKEFDVMGVGSFGPIDPVKGSETYGYITKTPKPYWSDFNMIGELKKHFDVPMEFDTDVNGAALAEAWWGAGEGLKNVMYITVGTGIGGGIILNNELFRGKNFVAGEFGHILIRKGEFEKFASTSALVRIVKEKTGKTLNGKEIFDLEKNGSEEIKNIVVEWIENLTDGLSSLVYSFNPDNIILGGGVIEQGEPLMKRIRKSLNKKVGPMFSEKLNISHAELGNNAGMLGAAYLLLEKIKKG